ncbi:MULTISPECIES: hypothetical protein [Citromicrobium]|uniref:hypothetical protein n=1 Tax=Citromicrobium TaxID=72173 RepID=UPI0001DD0CB4|nr:MULTISPECIES: hypothetical protein [Citromicrobium]ALG59548.1 hypothetical protein WG74_00695 [Citromicrobium sp. JL477]KPM17345.1 hypothetical protein VO58_05720 [Citromicrobium sp. JL1351]KPM20283.1 hypothetical protein VM77_04515 [Citromicrobium sp. JL31]KPM29173.1 hypothetical protein VO57_03850 [Citromicrobium sp. JL2201]
MTESDHTAQTHAGKGAGFTQSTAFVIIVGLWFAALFGGGCLLLPPVLFDAAFSGEPPFGPNTRIIFVAVAAGLGLLLGLFIASRVRSDDEQAPRSIETSAEPRKTRKRKARAPLDVRAALGMLRGAEDEDADKVAEEKERPAPPPQDARYELTDEIGPPIDDPYFASAWSDSGSHDADVPTDETEDAEQDESVPLPGHDPQVFGADAAPDDGSDDAWPVEQEIAQPTPVPQPSRYNPFADFVSKEEPEDAEPRRKEAPAAQPLSFAPAAQAQPPLDLTQIERMMSRPTAPPPPPVWPAPRAEEPELQELGVAELVERLARALQGEAEAQAGTTPPRTGAHRHESALAPKSVPDESDIDRALRVALDRLTRLDDVA